MQGHNPWNSDKNVSSHHGFQWDFVYGLQVLQHDSPLPDDFVMNTKRKTVSFT